jgi:hypothetical protein
MNTPAAIQGSGRRLMAIGPVSGLGAGTITVSGYAYKAQGAVIHIDGHPGMSGQIQLGDIVSVLADSTNGGSEYAASDIMFSGSVRGTVTSIDTQTGTFYVLGQVIHTDSNTTYSAEIHPCSLGGLKVGATVEVSAFANSEGDLVASNVTYKGTSMSARVVGAVHALDPVGHSFYLNALKVDYGSANVTGVVSEGAAITVQGNKFSSDGALVARTVHVDVHSAGTPGSGGRVQGLITQYSSSAYFEINGQAVVVGPDTKLTLPVPLGLDVSVFVTGYFNTNGELVADTVQTLE